jgi:hypothetical protein
VGLPDEKTLTKFFSTVEKVSTINTPEEEIKQLLSSVELLAQSEPLTSAIEAEIQEKSSKVTFFALKTDYSRRIVAF